MYAKRLPQVFQDLPNPITHTKTKGISINKYLADAGVASRRKSEEIIASGRVKINDQIATLGNRVIENDIVTLDGKLIEPITDKVYIALNKPAGIISTTDRTIENNIIDYMHLEESIFTIGRLDKESKGLILLTNDGDIVNDILRSQNGHEKEYLVKVSKPIDKHFIDYMQAGVMVYNERTNQYQQTLPCTLKEIDPYSFTIILKQGLNRQIRRMVSALGNEVVELERKRIMNITLENLPEGYYRYLTHKELSEIHSMIHKEKPILK